MATDTNTGPRDASTVARSQRTKAAVAMKIKGANYTKIASTLGYVSATQARHATSPEENAETAEENAATRR